MSASVDQRRLPTETPTGALLLSSPGRDRSGPPCQPAERPTILPCNSTGQWTSSPSSSLSQVLCVRHHSEMACLLSGACCCSTALPIEMVFSAGVCLVFLFFGKF
ncbi:hypothetical protein AALO_G00202700 [Alosa alosa]|uniref:Uncharacterized protein n=1 Tax=Alosa alosa TaxID=278164 RepID=A0AAV6G7F7_9TELE|nr:hypothetical protein AALO_G00202700 [Alosa alosa]